MKRSGARLPALLLAALPASAHAQRFSLSLGHDFLLFDLPLLIMLGCAVWLLAQRRTRAFCNVLIAWVALIAVAILLGMLGLLASLALLVAAPWIGAILMGYQCNVVPGRRDREPPPA